MSTFETPAVDAALLQRINTDLRIALREAGAILAKQGRSPAEAWEATQPFLPLMVLLRSLTDAPQGALPDLKAEDEIEQQITDPVSNVVPFVPPNRKCERCGFMTAVPHSPWCDQTRGA